MIKLFSELKEDPLFAGACIATCFPFNAPAQWGGAGGGGVLSVFKPSGYVHQVFR